MTTTAPFPAYSGRRQHSLYGRPYLLYLSMIRIGLNRTGPISESNSYPPIDLEGESRTMSLQRPATYAIHKFRKFECMPFLVLYGAGLSRRRQRQGFQQGPAARSDNRLSLRTATSNRPSPNASVTNSSPGSNSWTPPLPMGVAHPGGLALGLR
ncbi:hypothetical protein BGY98DRAFT_103256 [Russula aff. rugulosa BPL654]|nr:hypothetical protein BGY98DRAFT_103256 [Russula aff. rugulosa BPL654]